MFSHSVRIGRGPLGPKSTAVARQHGEGKDSVQGWRERICSLEVDNGSKLSCVSLAGLKNGLEFGKSSLVVGREISLPGLAHRKRELTVSAGSELAVNAVLEKVQ